MAKKERIVVDTFIKGMSISAKPKAKKLTYSLTFEKIGLTSNQRDKILAMVENKDPIQLSFESMQEDLPGMA